MAKRSKNYCRACHSTWFPRGQDLSDQCPKCESTSVTFESLALMPIAQVAPQSARAWTPPRPQAPSSSGTTSFLIAIAIGGGLLVMFVVIVFAAALTSKKKTGALPPEERPRETANAGPTSTAGSSPGAPGATVKAATGPAPAPAVPADDPGGGGCTCGDGTPGCCGQGCCSHHGGTGGRSHSGGGHGKR